MLTKSEIEQKTRAAWNAARSLNVIRALSQFYMEQSRDQKFCVAPYQGGPLTVEECQHVDALMHLQSYGIIPLGGVGPTGIYWEQIDGKYVHTRKLSDFLFLIRHGVNTERFLNMIKADNRLNKQVKDFVSGANRCEIKRDPTVIQREAPNVRELVNEPFKVINRDTTAVTLTLEDCFWEEVGGVYICRVMLAIDNQDFMAWSDSYVAKMMQKLHLLQTITSYAQQTLHQTENDYILPRYYAGLALPQTENDYILPPYTSFESQHCILDELEWHMSDAPETATCNDERAVLSRGVFASPVKLLLPNRYLDMEEDESAGSDVTVYEILVDGGSLEDILRAIQQKIVEMDTAAGKEQHADKLFFEGLQRHDDYTWVVNIS